MIEKQELHCHNCQRYVQFEIDVSLNGNHVLNCPNCGHEHCRVVKDGNITDKRWDQRNGETIIILSVATTYISTYDTYASVTSSDSAQGATFLYHSWMNAGTTA